MNVERFRVLGIEVARLTKTELKLDEFGFRLVVSADRTLRVHGLLVKGGELNVYTLASETVQQILNLPEEQARVALKEVLERIGQRFLNRTRHQDGGRSHHATFL